MADEQISESISEGLAKTADVVAPTAKKRAPRAKKVVAEAVVAPTPADKPANLRRAQKSQSDGKAAAAVKPKRATSAKNSSSPQKPGASVKALLPAIDEMAELLQLEEENSRLRKALGDKLRAENAELRKKLGLA